MAKQGEGKGGGLMKRANNEEERMETRECRGEHKSERKGDRGVIGEKKNKTRNTRFWINKGDKNMRGRKIS